MSFAELGLSDKVLQAVTTAGYSQPTPIQTQAIPHVLARRDVLGIAQTGTGKTAAFTLPMLTLLENGRARARMPRTLILEPTRELAAQVEENFDRYGANHRLSVALLIGGVSFGDQDMKITRGVDVLIATPGRLLDHFERGKLLLTGVELLVIDEADRMLDMGFIPDIERIVKLVPFTRQTLFFSATMPSEIQTLADAFLHNPVKVEVARPASAATTITQRLVATGDEDGDKRDSLRQLIRTTPDFKNAIIFCNRKREVATLHRSLVKHGFNAAALHGDLDQRARMAALESFRNGSVALLVASDVAARGLDIPAVSHVFNYDIPHHAEDYVHRIGRTGRAGLTGHSYTLIAPGDEKSLAAIEKLTGQPIEWEGRTVSEQGLEPRRRERGGKRERDGEGVRRGGSRGGRGAPAPRLSTRRDEDEGAPRPRRLKRSDDSRPEPSRAEAEPSEARPPRARRGNPGRPAAGRSEIGRPPAATERPSAAAVPPARSRERDRPPPRGDRPSERAERPSLDDAVQGLGDHVPAFLMRPAGERSRK